jgi:hypothetical protein
MSSSSSVTLFSEQYEITQKPYSFVFSVLAHILVIGLLFLGINSAPRVKSPKIAEHYDVRHLDLHTLESEMKRAVKIENKADRSPFKASVLPPGDRSDAKPPALRQMVQAPPGLQTLVQPDIPKPIALTMDIPLPTVVIWNGKKTEVKTIAPPPPEQPPVADVKPSAQMPNEEQNLADLAIPASDLALKEEPVLPSTSALLVVQGPNPSPPATETTAQGDAQPSTTALMSLSDQRMANGAVTLPNVNSSVATASPGVPGSGETTDTAQAGARGLADPQDNASNAQSAANGSAQPGSTLASQPSAARIVRPKNGQFGAVVVGSSLQEKFPETSTLWSGRLSYTVYLPVGLAKSWILQYSLSREDSAAQAGNISRIEAPWPYTIVRPNLAAGAIDADALMVHGFVNQAGRLESLSVAFPPEFTQAQFVLNALYQWEFRPAKQDGQNVKVEVLLIIPEVPE